MMNQFEHWTIAGVHYLFIVDTSRYDEFIGMRRIVAILPPKE